MESYRARRVLGFATLLLVLVAVRPAVAAAPTEQLRQRIDEITRMLQDPAFRQKPADERHAELRRVADQAFDWNEMAKRSLGVHWRERTPAERTEFEKLFSDLLERAYVSKIEAYQGEPIRYLGDTAEGNYGVVKTSIVPKQGNPVQIDYRVLQEADRWQVYDVVIAGVSLVDNYRTQFNDVIRRSSYADLVRRIKARLAEREPAAPAASPRGR